MILCRRFDVCDESLNSTRNEPNKISKAIGGRQRIHKLANLSFVFVVRRSSFHRHGEGGNNDKNQSKTKGKSNL